MLGVLYKLHKWIGVGIGLILGMWLISGLVMTILPERPSRLARGEIPALDLSGATVSPAQAVAALGTSVDQIELLRIVDAPVYRLSSGSTSALLDARSGAPFVVTDSVARAIAERLAGRSDASRVVAMKGKGEAAGYRVSFSGRPGLVVEVSSSDGTARSSDRVNRFRKTIGGLHSFRVLSGVVPGRNTPGGLLVLSGLIALFCVITGYLVTLARRERTRSTEES